MPQQKGTINEYKKLLYKKQYTYLKVLQLRYCGRDSIIQVRNRPYFHYGPFGRTKNKWRWYRHIKHHVGTEHINPWQDPWQSIKIQLFYS